MRDWHTGVQKVLRIKEVYARTCTGSLQPEMSNGDEVLDDWEEIDEVGLTSTLQKIQQKQLNIQPQLQNDSAKQSSKLPNTLSGASQFEQTTNTTISLADPKHITLSNVDFPTRAVAANVPMKLLQRNANTNATSGGGSNVSATAGGASTGIEDLKTSPLDDMTASFQPVMMLLHKPADEYQSTTYVTPTNLQTVKILRRPTQSMEPRNNGIKLRQPIKTLQQREQEYAEARLRIMGSAKNPEDDVGAPNSSNNSTSTTTVTVNTTASTNNSYKSNNTPSPKVNQSVINGGILGGGGGVGTSSPLNVHNISYNQNQMQKQQPPNYFYMQQQKQQQQTYLQKMPPPYNARSMSALLPLPLPATIQHQQLQHAPSFTQSPQAHNQQTWSPVVGGSVSSSAQRQQQQESLLRLPRGPDGSLGFQMRR